MPIAFDGDWLIDALVKRKNTKAVGKKLERFRSFNSVRVDLERCQEAVTVLEKRDAERPGWNREISAEDSLADASYAMLALVIYARSTDTSSSRGSFDPRRFYSAAQKKWHTSLISLRNEAIAHFGSGRHPGGEWAADKVLLLHDPETGRTGLGWRWQRAAFRGRAIAELGIILPLALAGLRDDLKKLEQSVFDELAEHSDTMVALLRDCPRTHPVSGISGERKVQVFERQAHILEGDDPTPSAGTAA